MEIKKYICLSLLIIILFSSTVLISAKARYQFIELTTNEFSQQDIDGLYYIWDDDPLGWLDEGCFRRNQPTHEAIVTCGLWIVLHFNEPGSYYGTKTIHNIYYHLWQETLSPPIGETYIVGYGTTSCHSGPMNESFYMNFSNPISYVDNYGLQTALQIVNPDIARFDGNDIFNFTLYSVGCDPNILISPKKSSFIILNIADNDTLKITDSDDDGLSDYAELFSFFTNPFSNDTDNDDASDWDELKASDSGYSNSDPNDYTNTTDFRQLYVDAGDQYEEDTGQSIQFIGSAVGGIQPYSWHWDYGTGDTSDVQNPIYSYTTPGTYTVTLTVSDNSRILQSISDITTVVITETPPPFSIHIFGGNGFLLNVTNTGDSEINNILWNITINNGLFIFPRKISGTIESIPMNESREIHIPVYGFSLGRITNIPTISVQLDSMNVIESFKIMFNKIVIQ